MEKVKLLIIGAGPGGYVAAIRAAQLGLDPVVVEKNELGGTCLNIGCIPTKAHIAAADRYHTAKNSSSMGIHAEVSFKWNEVVEHAKNTVKKNTMGVEYLFKKNKIRLVKGHAEFTDKYIIKVGEESFEAENIILATGSSVKTLPHIPIDGTKIISSDEALFQETLPESIAILGAGAIGTEFAYIYNMFGVEVHLIEAMDNIVPLEDSEVSKELLKSFKKSKIKCYTKTMVTNIEKSEDKLTVFLNNGKSIEVAQVLSAVGRKPNLENLGLEKTGVKKNDWGFIEVDKQFNTNIPGIYAIGDLIPTPMLAHTAEHEGVSLVERLAGLHPHEINYDLNPGCTYCEPSIASIGLSEKTAEERGMQFVTGKFPFSANGKAVASGHTAGFVKIIAEKESNKIIGAHIIGHGATDLISEFITAMKMGATLNDIVEGIHPHPTLSEATLEAALSALGRAIHI